MRPLTTATVKIRKEVRNKVVGAYYCFTVVEPLANE